MRDDAWAQSRFSGGTRHSMYFFSAEPRRGRRRRDVARWRTRLLQRMKMKPGEAAHLRWFVHVAHFSSRRRWRQRHAHARARAVGSSMRSIMLRLEASRVVSALLNADPNPGRARHGAARAPLPLPHVRSSRDGRKLPGRSICGRDLQSRPGYPHSLLSLRPEATLTGSTVAQTCSTRGRVDVDMGGYLIERGTWVPLGGRTTQRGR